MVGLASVDIVELHGETGPADLRRATPFRALALWLALRRLLAGRREAYLNLSAGPLQARRRERAAGMRTGPTSQLPKALDRLLVLNHAAADCQGSLTIVCQGFGTEPQLTATASCKAPGP